MGQTTTATQTKQAIKMPSMWHVILHNDDFTPFDFVIELLMVVFNKTVEEASTVAGFVHTKGKATVGLYTREVAQTKVDLASRIASEHQHPLLVTAEPA